jgi:hypothetical protein
MVKYLTNIKHTSLNKDKGSTGHNSRNRSTGGGQVHNHLLKTKNTQIRLH